MTPLSRARLLLIVVVVGFTVIASLLALLQGIDQIGPGFVAFFSGIAGSATAIAATTRYITPILLIAVSASISIRAGLFDVGQVGQFLIGAMVAGAIGAQFDGPGFLVATAALLGGALAGGGWAWLVGRLSQATQMQLTVLSLIANFFADGLVRFLTRTLLQDPEAYSVIATRSIPSEAWLPVLIPGTSLHLGFIIALAVPGVVWAVVRFTAVGHRLTMFGQNQNFAIVVGVDPRRYPLRVLLCSGAVAGFAGAVEVLGVYHRFQDGTLGGSNSIAWTGLAAAILIPSGLLVTIPVSVFLAALTTGLVGVQRDIGITSGLGTLVQGLLIVVAAVAMTDSAAQRPRRRRHRPVSSTARHETGPAQQRNSK